jgi:serine/threonine protein kinase
MASMVQKNIGSDPIWEREIGSDRLFRIKNDETIYYKIGKEIGAGSSSNVFSLEPEDKKKKIKAIKISRFAKNDFKSEFEILNALPSSEGVHLPAKAFFSSSLNSMIVMPKYEGTLFEIYNQMTPEMRLDAMNQLIKGLEALHEKHIYLIDIKLANVFFRSEGDKIRYDLGDFGLVSKDKDDFDRRWGVMELGKAFKLMIFSSDAFKMPTVTEENMKMKELPPSLANVINYMISPSIRDIKHARELFTACIKI